MKVLMLTCWYPTPQRPALGIFVREMARAVAAAGHDVVVSAIVAEHGPWYGRCVCTTEKVSDRLHVHLMQIQWRWHGLLMYLFPLLNWLHRRQLRQAILPTFQPQVLHAHVIYPAGLMAYRLASTLHIPWVLTEHWTRLNHFFSRHPYRHAARKALQQAHVTAVSHFLKNQLATYVTQPDRIDIVPNAVDTELFFFAEKPQRTELVFAAAALWAPPFKQLSLLVEALSEFAARSARPLRLVLMGDGPLVPPIRQKVDTLPFAIEFMGMVPKATVAAQLRRADFFLHASSYETFGVVVAEALATGTPVVASDLPTLRELIHADNGILCSNTVNQWLHALEQATQRTWNHRQISEAATRLYSFAAIGKTISDIYERLSPPQQPNGLTSRPLAPPDGGD